MKGNLTVHRGLDVAHTVEAAGAISAQDIDVGGKMIAKSISCGGSVRVGGLVDVKETMKAVSVGVGGKVKVSGTVEITDLGVGGKADVGGGSIKGHTRVGGVFASTAPLEFGELQRIGFWRTDDGSIYSRGAVIIYIVHIAGLIARIAIGLALIGPRAFAFGPSTGPPLSATAVDAEIATDCLLALGAGLLIGRNARVLKRCSPVEQGKEAVTDTPPKMTLT